MIETLFSVMHGRRYGNGRGWEPQKGCFSSEEYHYIYKNQMIRLFPSPCQPPKGLPQISKDAQNNTKPEKTPRLFAMSPTAHACSFIHSIPKFCPFELFGLSSEQDIPHVPQPRHYSKAPDFLEWHCSIVLACLLVLQRSLLQPCRKWRL